MRQRPATSKSVSVTPSAADGVTRDAAALSRKLQLPPTASVQRSSPPPKVHRIVAASRGQQRSRMWRRRSPRAAIAEFPATVEAAAACHRAGCFEGAPNVVGGPPAAWPPRRWPNRAGCRRQCRPPMGPSNWHAYREPWLPAAPGGHAASGTGRWLERSGDQVADLARVSGGATFPVFVRFILADEPSFDDSGLADLSQAAWSCLWVPAALARMPFCRKSVAAWPVGAIQLSRRVVTRQPTAAEDHDCVSAR